MEDENKVVSIVLPHSIDDMLNAIIMANTHKSRSQIVRDALKDYFENHLEKEVKEGAEAILKIRKKTITIINEEGMHGVETAD